MPVGLISPPMWSGDTHVIKEGIPCCLLKLSNDERNGGVFEDYDIQNIYDQYFIP